MGSVKTEWQSLQKVVITFLTSCKLHMNQYFFWLKGVHIMNVWTYTCIFKFYVQNTQNMFNEIYLAISV